MWPRQLLKPAELERRGRKIQKMSKIFSTLNKEIPSFFAFVSIAVFSSALLLVVWDFNKTMDRYVALSDFSANTAAVAER